MEFPFAEDIVLEDQRALLSPLCRDDFHSLLPVALADDGLLRYSPMPIASKDLLQRYIGTALQERQKESRYPFLIFDKRENAVAGSTSYMSISNRDDRLEIGHTWLGPQFQKTGLNRHCKYLLLSYAFDGLGCERVEFKTDERNKASRTALEKIGAVYEGTFRNHTVMSDGFRRNTVYYSILKEEWQRNRNDFLDKLKKRTEKFRQQTHP